MLSLFFQIFSFVYKGTGKTIVGTKLTSLFAERNKQQPCGETPHVLYCGPSNESVNVVAGESNGTLKICLIMILCISPTWTSDEPPCTLCYHFPLNVHKYYIRCYCVYSTGAAISSSPSAMQFCTMDIVQNFIHVHLLISSCLWL